MAVADPLWLTDRYVLQKVNDVLRGEVTWLDFLGGKAKLISRVVRVTHGPINKETLIALTGEDQLEAVVATVIQ
nr:hypothetical protein [uncultured Litoreibacter sp.]